MRTTIASLGLTCVLAVTGCAADVPAGVDNAVLTVRLAELPAEGVVSGEVSAPRTLDGVACRALKPGRAVAFDVDRWWGKTAQPAEGRMYLATVLYKDAVKQPARFYSYAGLGRYESPSEMHRFGGLGDGKWKLARVPLSWDMLLSLPSQKGRAPKSNPVSRGLLPRPRCCSRPLPQQLTDQVCQLLCPGRLQHIGAQPAGDKLLELLLHRVPRQQHHRHVDVPFPHDVEQADATHSGHDHVTEHQVDLVPVQHIQCPYAVPGL